MLHEKKIQTIFDEYFPQQILPSPVASRIKQQMQLQLSQQVRPVTVQNPAEQHQKINLLLAIEQWWDAFRPQFQPMPTFALTSATAFSLLLVYFWVQGNFLSDLAILQRANNAGSIIAAIPNDDFAAQRNISREPEVFVYPTIDDMQIADDRGYVHAVAIAPTATRMPIMPAPLAQTSSEPIILRPTARVVNREAVLPASMDHPPSDNKTSSVSPTDQEALINLPPPTSISIAIAPTQPTEPLPTVAVPIGNAQPISVAQMPTPNPNLSQTDIVLRPTPTYDLAATPITQSVAQSTIDTSLGVLGEGPSVPPGLAANGATATAQTYNTSSVISQVPTLLPSSEIGKLPTATQIPPVQVPSNVSTLSVETPIAVAAEATPWPSSTVLPTFTLVSAVPATETPAWVTPTPTQGYPEPTNTAVPTANSNSNRNDNNDSKKKSEDKKRDENRTDPQPKATPVPPVVNVPVAPTAPPPPPTSPPPTSPPPTSPPPTPVPEPIQPDLEPVRTTAAALALPPTATPPPPPTSVPPTTVPPTEIPPTQPPPTAKPVLPVHTATPKPTKRLPTATPIRVEIAPVVGVAEPTPRPTAIVQQPTAISEPVRESGLGAEPVTGKDTNPVKPVFTPTSPPDRSRPTPIRVEINPQPSAPKVVPTLTPRPTSKPIVLNSDAESDRLLGKDEESELESAAE